MKKLRIANRRINRARFDDSGEVVMSIDVGLRHDHNVIKSNTISIQSDRFDREISYSVGIFGKGGTYGNEEGCGIYSNAAITDFHRKWSINRKKDRLTD